MTIVREGIEGDVSSLKPRNVIGIISAGRENNPVFLDSFLGTLSHKTCLHIGMVTHDPEDRILHLLQDCGPEPEGLGRDLQNRIEGSKDDLVFWQAECGSRCRCGQSTECVIIRLIGFRQPGNLACIKVTTFIWNNCGITDDVVAINAGRESGKPEITHLNRGGTHIKNAPAGVSGVPFVIDQYVNILRPDERRSRCIIEMGNGNDLGIAGPKALIGRDHILIRMAEKRDIELVAVMFGQDTAKQMHRRMAV